MQFLLPRIHGISVHNNEDESASQSDEVSVWECKGHQKDFHGRILENLTLYRKSPEIFVGHILIQRTWTLS